MGWRKDRDKSLKIPGYNIDLEKAIKTINNKDYKNIILQIPEGLKQHLSSFIDLLEKETKANIIISADPCYGACDLINFEFQNLDVDLVIQIGHTSIPGIENFSIPTIFING